MKLIVRKSFALLLAAVMAAGTSSCKKAPSSSAVGTPSEVTLTYWHIYTADPQKTMVANIVGKWNAENPNIQVQATATENDAYKTKIKTAISADQAPDIIYSWTQGFAQPFVEANKILVLDSYLNDGTRDRMLPGALDNITYGGKVYGLTYNQQAGALYVNTSIFKKYNVSIPTTFDELLAAVKTFRSKGVTPIALGNKDGWPGMWVYDMLALREGGGTLSQDALTGKASFTDPAFSDAAARLLDLVNAGAFDPGVLGLAADEANGTFSQGGAAMTFGGNFWAAEYETSTSAVKGKVEAVRFPTVEGGKGDKTEYIGGGSDALLISMDSKYKDQAVRAAKYIAQQLSSQSYLNGSGLPEWKYTDIDETKVDPLTKQIMDNIVEGAKDAVPAWDSYLTGDKAQTHKDLVAQLFGKTISSGDFASEMQSKLNGK